MREQTIVMHAAKSSGMLSELAEAAEAVLFEGASFVLGLGIAYLAVCYGIPIGTLEKVEQSNP